MAAFCLTPPAAFPPDQFPVAAYSHIPPGARLFAPDKFGGYLIYRSNGSLKVFFDGRSDLYGAEFLKQYSRLVQVRPGWREYWDSFHFTHALLPADAPLLPALRATRLAAANIRTKPRFCWHSPELNHAAVCYNRTSAEFRRKTCLGVCLRCTPPVED